MQQLNPRAAFLRMSLTHAAHVDLELLNILVRVVDAELLQEEAVVEEATVHLGQELEDDAFLRPEEDNGVVPMGTCLVVHNNACETVPGREKHTSSLETHVRGHLKAGGSSLKDRMKS